MIGKVRTKAVDYTKRIIGKEMMKDFVREFLPRDTYLEQQLQEICSECPLHVGEEDHREFTPSDWESLDRCRMHYFGFLLQSFIGRPGSGETKWLYSYLERCEECLLSSAGNASCPREQLHRPLL